VALVKPGKAYQVVTNVESKRKTPNVVAFYAEERLFGGHADAKRASKPRHVVPEPFALLGRAFSHPRTAAYANGSDYMVALSRNARGGADLLLPPGSVAASAGEPSFSAEEAAAQVLLHVREFTEAFAELRVPQAALTVPMYATQAERAALLDAAELAGFKVLALVEENTAAGVHYGIDRVTENTTHHMLLYNMGAEATQVTLFAYDSYVTTAGGKNTTVGQGRVVAKAYDLGLGGRAFDKVLRDAVVAAFDGDAKMVAKLPKEAGGTLAGVPAAMIKVAKGVTKTKEVLSANEAFPISFEGLLPDVDFRLPYSREALEKGAAAAGLWARVTGIVEDVLAQAGLPLERVDAVELVGGSVRVPRVQALLKEFFAGKGAKEAKAAGASRVGTHMNGDECFALGAVFVAANRSTSLKVRKVGMVDKHPFSVGVRLTHLGAGAAAGKGAAADAKPWSKRSASLFKVYNNLDEKKKLSFTSDKDLRAAIYYENTSIADVKPAPALPPGTSPFLGYYNVTGVEALMANATFAARGAPKVHLTFQLDMHGMVALVKAEATQEEEVLVPEPTPKPTPLALNLTGLAKNSTGNATGNATNATDAVNATPPPAEASASPDAASAASAASPDASAPANASTAAPSPKMKLVKNTLHFPLTITLITEGAFPVTPLNASEKAAVLVRFRALKAEDDAKRALEGAKNALEAAIFATNDWLETMADAVSKVTNAAQRSEVAAATANHTEWLESDSVGAGISVFQDRLQALQDLVDPIKFRIEEHEERPNLLEAATKALSTWTTTVKSWTDTHPQVR
jgi:hypoxia up-regulated 1